MLFPVKTIVIFNEDKFSYPVELYRNSINIITNLMNTQNVFYVQLM